MAKFQEGLAAAVKQLAKALTRDDIEKIQILLAIPNRIIEKIKVSDEPGIKLLTLLKKWDGFNPVEFMRVIEEMENRELLSLAKKVHWLNASVPKQATTESKTAHTFIELLHDVSSCDWEIIGQSITESDNTEEILNSCIQEGIISKDLNILCKAMTEIERVDLVPKIQNYASMFEGLSEEEFKAKLLSEIEYEGEDNHSQWMRKLREYMLLQHKDVSVILDSKMVAFKSVYTPLTVIKQETDRVKPEEETSVKEIEFLKEMIEYETAPMETITKKPSSVSTYANWTTNLLKKLMGIYQSINLTESQIDPESVKTKIKLKQVLRSNIEVKLVDFESHLSYCRTEKPEIWTLIGNPGCGKTFLCKYAGYQYGMDNIENFQYLLCIPCRHTEWHEIEVARQEDKEINKYILRWLRISLPLGVGWAESLIRYIMRTGGESLLLIIDGLDEFIKSVPFETTLLYLLLQKRILPSATILLTSRPGAWSNVATEFGNQMNINSHYQVLGFSPMNRDAYFKKRMNNESKLEDTNKLFERHEELNLLALVPVNASLFSALFNNTDDILAQTVTDVYQELITYMVRRQLSRMGLKRYTKVSKISGFTTEITDCISAIGLEAYKGIYDRELVCKDDVTLSLAEKEYQCERLGLMQEHFVVLKFVGRVKVWVYAHLTLQEFMSALWLSYQKWTQQCMIVRYLVSSNELFVMFRMVIRFVCGILCDRSIAMQSILCKKLIPYTTPHIPMYSLLYDLRVDSHKMLNLSNWPEFSRILLDLIPSILESKPGPSLLSYVKHILPESLQFYFESALSPNQWYTFLLSLPHLPHIQMIFIDVDFISTEQFRTLISRIDQCSLNYLALTFRYKDSSTILSYTSIISSDMPAHIKISITLEWCHDIEGSDILFPPPANRFIGSLGIHETDIPNKCIKNLISKFSSLQYFYYHPEKKHDWSMQELLTHHKPSNGLLLVIRYKKVSFDIPLDIFSQLSSLQEIHLVITDPYSFLPHLQSFCNLTYLAISLWGLLPVHESYGDILIQIIRRNSNTLRVIKLACLYSIGIVSWDSILAPIQHCNKLIELEITHIKSEVNKEIMSINTSVDYLQSLIKLYLHCIPLSSSEVYTLCDGLAYSPVIKEIRMNDCELDSTSCVHFTNLIPTLPQLKELNFLTNELSSPDPTQVELLRQTADEYCVIHKIR